MDTPHFSAHGSRRNGNRLFFGLILILIGIIFLMQQIGNFNFKNWWALFILIPAFGSFSTARYAYQRNHLLNEGVRAGLGGGMITLSVALMFLFNLNWSIWWPMMVVVPGLVVLFNGFSLPGSREASRPLSMRLYRPWSGWIGLAAIFLGMGFLLNNLGLLHPEAILRNWWALAILIPAVGGLVTAVRLAAAGTALGWSGISNLTSTCVFAVVGIVALLGIGWNLLAPVILIALGLVLMAGIFRRQA